MICAVPIGKFLIITTVTDVSGRLFSRLDNANITRKEKGLGLKGFVKKGDWSVFALVV